MSAVQCTLFSLPHDCRFFFSLHFFYAWVLFQLFCYVSLDFIERAWKQFQICILFRIKKETSANICHKELAFSFFARIRICFSWCFVAAAVQSVSMTNVYIYLCIAFSDLCLQKRLNGSSVLDILFKFISPFFSHSVILTNDYPWWRIFVCVWLSSKSTIFYPIWSKKPQKNVSSQ